MDKLLSSPHFAHQVPSPETLRYGTAGFRLSASAVAPIAIRLGAVFVDRAAALVASGAQPNGVPLCFGVMVTASHNPSADNGLKIVEPPHAHMLAPQGEALATTLARTKTADEFKAAVEKALAAVAGGGSDKLGAWRVVVGWDTRPSCAGIVEAITLGVEAVGGTVVRAGEMPTPVLHWCVEMANRPKEVAAAAPPVSLEEKDNMTINTYLTDRYSWFAKAVTSALASHHSSSSSSSKEEQQSTTANEKKIKRHIIVDCANGAGADSMERLVGLFDKSPIPGVEYTWQLINTDTKNLSVLNDKCGADFVQKQQELPVGLTAEDFIKISAKTAAAESSACLMYSLDGDADRLVAGAINREGKPVIFEGDRFTALFATVLCHGAKQPQASSSSAALTYGAVQTAYANGSSTHYLRNCSKGAMSVEFALTGVKHVHAAATKFDIGVYFESNGHGTVLATGRATSPASALTNEGRVVSALCSQSCGDAIANLLATEFALLALQWTPQQWLDLYTDLPTVQKKVPVPDPSVFKCVANNEQKLMAPEGIQDEIDKLIGALKDSLAKKEDAERVRAFVRPSGTESVVRLYVEAPSSELAQSLTGKLEALVQRAVA